MSAIRHIRKTVFRLNQAEFAAVAGVTQATISRWEKGGSPTLEEMQRIRDAAAKRKIKWSDKLFFEAPKSDERASA